jgi:diaminohydroxyphosphoribosylaminopyrimidine deaminase/5-amino-6-(5-phosphoribosylamino)uracil reductase
MRYLRSMHSDEYYMQMCLDLAKKGLGNVAPNPMVGAVIVHDDKIIGQGFHEKYGDAHAEVNAVNSVKNASLLKESTIYVSLEPCAHFGKTPPCCDLIISNKFKRVVIGTQDPFEAVDGNGIDRIKNNGIDITVGVLEDECQELNKAFFAAHTKKRPYVTLKWAQTRSGKIDAGKSDQEIAWISGPESKKFVHQLRVENQAILVGYNTVVNDDPELTVREVKGKNPIRIVLDRNSSLNKESKVFNNASETIILNSSDSGSILQTLYSKNIISLLIEGGKKTLQAFIDAELWDEAYIIEGVVDFEDGTKAPELNTDKPVHSFHVGKDQINHYRR